MSLSDDNGDEDAGDGGDIIYAEIYPCVRHCCNSIGHKFFSHLKTEQRYSCSYLRRTDKC